MRQLTKRFHWNHPRSRCHTILFLDARIDFVAVDFDGRWRLDTEPHLPALNAEDDDPDVRTDRDSFSLFSRQDQHLRFRFP